MALSQSAHYFNSDCTGFPSGYEIGFPAGGCVPKDCVPLGEKYYFSRACVNNLDDALMQARETWSKKTIISIISYDDINCAHPYITLFHIEGFCHYDGVLSLHYAKKTLRGSQILTEYYHDNQCLQRNSTAAPYSETCRASPGGNSVLHVIQNVSNFLTSPNTITPVDSTSPVPSKTTDYTSEYASSQISDTAMIGIIIGSVALFVIIVFALAFAARWRKVRRNPSVAPPPSPVILRDISNAGQANSVTNHSKEEPATEPDLTQPASWTTEQTCTWLSSLAVGSGVVLVFRRNRLDGPFLQAISSSVNACTELLRVDVGLADMRTRVVLAGHIVNLFHGNGEPEQPSSSETPPSYALLASEAGNHLSV
ncbi:hypothetical protein BC830DRAFT_1115382 [Chytriomyces sp. MP71]|nr:hypothetical protein BC830DRAFT_1115382 [Chytriomyces sp. MP71]